MAKLSNIGRQGPTGQKGEPGQRGERGERGLTGPAGPRLNRADVLAMVDDQFKGIRKEMNLQLVRMGQIQAQLDQIHTMVKKLVRQGGD